MTPAPPLVVIAELTHRCPLSCAYCSNPVKLTSGESELELADWQDVVEQAAELGVLQLHLTGGEPLLRPDLEHIAAHAARCGLYTTLITSGVGGARAPVERVQALAERNVRAVQVSFQDTRPAAARAIAGRHALAEKLAFARRVIEAGMSLTTNFVLHRDNLDQLEQFVTLSLQLGADRVELAHVQYHGWAALNRKRLLPTPEQIARADRTVAAIRRKHAGALEIVYVMPDHFSGRPKPCMSGWGRRALVVSPDGKLLPCHGASALPFELDRAPQRSLRDSWNRGRAFAAFRGEAWMEEPCRSCPERRLDYGGCRCQAFALTGRASATDPACSKSPHHEELVKLRLEPRTTLALVPRRMRPNA